jgi:hypothetical protein
MVMALAGIAGNIGAAVKVHNDLPWPIKLEYHWFGLMPANGFFKPWVSSKSFEVKPGETVEHNPEWGNIKTRYIVSIKDEKGEWVAKYDQKVTECCNRYVRVYSTVKNPATGEIVISLITHIY